MEDTIVVVNGLYNPALTKQNQGGQPELFVPKLHLLQSKYTEHTDICFSQMRSKNLYLEKFDQTRSVFG